MKATSPHFLLLLNKFVLITPGITGKRFPYITHNNLLKHRTETAPSAHLMLQWSSFSMADKAQR